MNFIEHADALLKRFIGNAKDEHVARREKSESDVASDAGVAGSRANTDGDDGSYVGRSSPQVDAEVQQSGAEARSEAERRPPR